MSNMLQKFSFWTFLFQKNKLRLYIYICVTGYMWKLEKYIEKEALLKIIFKLAVMIKKVYPVPRNALSCYQLARIWKERRKVILFERIHFGDLCSFFKICKNVHRRFGSNRNRLDQAGTKALKLSGFFNSLICFPFSFLIHLNIHLAIFSSFGLFTDFLLMGFSVLFLSSCRRRPFLLLFFPCLYQFPVFLGSVSFHWKQFIIFVWPNNSNHPKKNLQGSDLEEKHVRSPLTEKLACDAFPKSPLSYNTNGYASPHVLPPLKFRSGFLGPHSTVTLGLDDHTEEEEESVASAPDDTDGNYSEVSEEEELELEKPFAPFYDEEIFHSLSRRNLNPSALNRSDHRNVSSINRGVSKENLRIEVPENCKRFTDGELGTREGVRPNSAPHCYSQTDEQVQLCSAHVGIVVAISFKIIERHGTVL